MRKNVKTQIATTAVAAAVTLAFGAAAVLGAGPDQHDDHAPAKAAVNPTHASEKPAAKPVSAKPAVVKPTAGQANKPSGAVVPQTKPTSGGPDVSAAARGKSSDETDVDSAKALQMLRDGNARWVTGEVDNPNISAARRAEVGKGGQHPFVTVLTCADSRLPVERIFDRGVGDVFVIRVAGNIAGDSEVGTIEYGVGHLKTPLIVVMGHTKCGAVAAAASGAASKLHGPLQQLVRTIEPGVDRARRNNPEAEGDELTALSIRENVWQSVYDLLKRSPEVRAAVRAGEVRVVGAVCDIITGKVDFLGPHPWESELLDALEARKPTISSAEAEKDEH